MSVGIARSAIAVAALAGNTVREALAGRAWLAVAAVAALIVVSSAALGALTLDDPALVARHVGLAGVDFGGIGLAVALGVGLTARELEGGTAAMVLTRPVSRRQLVVGRWLGIAIASALGVAALVAALLLALARAPEPQLPAGGLAAALAAQAWLYLVQALVVASVALLTAVWLRPLPAGACALGLAVIGRGLPALRLIGQRAGGVPGRALELISVLLPNLYLYDPASPPSGAYVAAATVYGVGYAGLAVVVAAAAVGRRDFV